MSKNDDYHDKVDRYEALQAARFAGILLEQATLVELEQELSKRKNAVVLEKIAVLELQINELRKNLR